MDVGSTVSPIGFWRELLKLRVSLSSVAILPVPDSAKIATNPKRGGAKTVCVQDFFWQASVYPSVTQSGTALNYAEIKSLYNIYISELY